MKKRIKHYFEISDQRGSNPKTRIKISQCDKCHMVIYFKGMTTNDIQKEFRHIQQDKQYKSYYGIKNGQYTYAVYMRRNKNNVYFINPFTGKILYKKDCNVALRDKLIKEIIR